MISQGKRKSTGFKRQENNADDSFETDYDWIKRDFGLKNWDLLMPNSPLKKVACSKPLLKRNIQHIHIPQKTEEEELSSESATQGDDILDGTFNLPSTFTPGTVQLTCPLQQKTYFTILLKNLFVLVHCDHVMMTSKFVKMVEV